MESWRERGYVPDSDSESEAGFDSQDIEALTAKDNGDGGSLDVTASAAEAIDTGDGTGKKGHELQNDDDNDESPAPDDKEIPNSRDDDVKDQELSESADERDTTVEQSQDGGQSVTLSEKENERLEGHGESSTQNTEDQETQSNATEKKLDNNRSQELSGAPATNSPSTPRAKPIDIWDVPSSSPDELQFEFRPTRKPAALLSTTQKDQGRQPTSEKSDLSPLSSPPSSPQSSHSLRVSQDNENNQSSRENQVPQNNQNGQNQSEMAADNDLDDLLPPLDVPEDIHIQDEIVTDNNFNDLLPPLDIPEDILEELTAPSRRSLRTRNPIQLHPYLLEDAKYQTLMRARGVKPVRIAQYQQKLREANESQNQNSFEDPGPPSSSPMNDFQSLPSSPVDHQRVSEKRPQTTPRPFNRQHSRSVPQPTSATDHAAKRRKVSHPSNNRQSDLQNSPRPRVIIDNSSTPRAPNTDSIFDIPPSPPHSGSVSSSKTVRPSKGIRFPPELAPPTLNTPMTASRSQTDDAGDDNAMDLSGIGDGVDQMSNAAQSISSQSDANSGTENEDNNDEVAVQAMRRKIKGVLPASWLRLDQEKQKQKLPSSTQRNRELDRRGDNAKGVAQKISRRNGSFATQNPRSQLSSLSHLADDDSDDEEQDGSTSARDNSRQDSASMFEMDDLNRDHNDVGDFMEDNRIDYMFPSTSRGPATSRSGKTSKKRQLPEKERGHSGGYRKRVRLKRQTRITDPEFGGRKAKSTNRRTPRLGVLDAHDVAERPRKEQPQFLRVAARQARSRRDSGRASPTRKVMQLSSRADTEDANVSLRQWRKGKIPQQRRLTKSQPKPRQPRRSLQGFVANKGAFANKRIPRDTGKDSLIHANPVIQLDERPAISDRSPNPLLPRRTQIPKQNVASKRADQPEQHGSKWVIRRNLAISSLKRNTLRSAEPDIANVNSNIPSSSVFQRSLSRLNQDYRQRRAFETHNQSLTLDRFLSDSVSSAAVLGNQQTLPFMEANRSKGTNAAAHAEPRRRQIRKRPPKRLDVASAEPEEPLSPEPVTQVSHAPKLDHGGLTSFQRSYTVDFSITPLSCGTFFHESTFVGSGEFARSLDVLTRDMDKDVGLFTLKIEDRTFRWGPWNDTVSSELGSVFERLCQGIEKNSTASTSNGEGTSSRECSLYKSLVKYTTGFLTFIDPIDRTGFVARARTLVSELSDHLSTLNPTTASNREHVVRLTSYSLVFSNQIRQIASHNLVDDDSKNEAQQLVVSVSKQLLTLISDQAGLTEGIKFLQNNKVRDRRDAGVRDDCPTVEAYIITQHILRSTDNFKGFFDKFVAEAYLQSENGSQSKLKEIPHLETRWHGLFTTLPLGEIDQFGIARIGSRFKYSYDNWTIVKRLLSPVLDDYHANSATRPISYNNYCRALFHRCFHLINGWGWRDCRVILNTLYDFFATKTALYNLSHEESFRSPAFLDELDHNPSLEVMHGDPCFHIFLKIIGSGFRFMSRVYDKKKIRNFAWCLLPNHGRVYPKEASIRQEDLDALRNHHDLLCTLYFAVPDGCRPRLESIKNLVHPGSSHREACNISIRSWTRLIRFKLSKDEDVSGLDAFADWHSFFMTELLKQHSLARKEIEAQSGGNGQFSQKVIERTISQNQQQIESLLSAALGGLQSAVQLSPTLEHSQRIVAKMPVKAALGLFNARSSRVNATVSEALQVVAAYVQKCDPPAPAAVQISADEDSQEFGDWTGLEDIYRNEPSPPNQGIEHVEKVFHPAVSRLVSNCFGEDHCPDDAILLTVVDCWTSIARTLVSQGIRHWDTYLTPYDPDSWAALRSTVQTRKFTPQFLAICIEKDTRFISEYKSQVFAMWMSTLVERASMLKFQHRLTEALLNKERANYLLQNLPFSRDRKNDRYSITLEDFSQRRLSLISSLLSNMREHLQDMEDTHNRDLSLTKSEYRELIQKLMASMKSNYQELGSGAESVQGAYVDFVHRVVGFLQQHTREICPIDPFFTDPTSFPLPSTDPTYIVARLKGYEPKLSVERVAKTLIIFIQGVSERAAIDGQQAYLVEQLHSSITGTYEAGNPKKPTLRAVLLQSVFPVYLDTAFNNPAAWILTLPILQTISLIFQDLLFNMDTTDPNCILSVTAIFHSVFQSSYQALQGVAEDASMLKEPTVLLTVTAFIEMITSALRVIDYIDRATDQGEAIVLQVRAFRAFALFASSRLNDQVLPDDADNLANFLKAASHCPATNADTEEATIPAFFQEARHSASRELQVYINESWSRHQGKYYFTRRGCRKPQEVGVDPSIAVKVDHLPTDEFQDAVAVFLNTLNALGLCDES